MFWKFEWFGQISRCNESKRASSFLSEGDIGLKGDPHGSLRPAPFLSEGDNGEKEHGPPISRSMLLTIFYASFAMGSSMAISDFFSGARFTCLIKNVSTKLIKPMMKMTK